MAKGNAIKLKTAEAVIRLQKEALEIKSFQRFEF